MKDFISCSQFQKFLSANSLKCTFCYQNLSVFVGHFIQLNSLYANFGKVMKNTTLLTDLPLFSFLFSLAPKNYLLLRTREIHTTTCHIYKYVQDRAYLFSKYIFSKNHTQWLNYRKKRLASWRRLRFATTPRIRTNDCPTRQKVNGLSHSDSDLNKAGKRRCRGESKKFELYITWNKTERNKWTETKWTPLQHQPSRAVQRSMSVSVISVRVQAVYKKKEGGNFFFIRGDDRKFSHRLSYT